jgi:hypothetical protein
MGAWGAVGMLVLLPWLREKGRSISNGWIVVLHIGLVLASTRIFGLWETAAASAAGIGVVYVLVLAGLMVFGRKSDGPPLEDTGSERDVVGQGPR